jgi:hypothetical protein
MAAKVYIVNKSAHDFSQAEKFGKLIFMSEGRLNRYGTNDMVRKFTDAMRNSREEDFLLPCSLNTANIMAGAIFAMKHKRLNLLLYKPSTGEYIERVHIFE